MRRQGYFLKIALGTRSEAIEKAMLAQGGLNLSEA